MLVVTFAVVKRGAVSACSKVYGFDELIDQYVAFVMNTADRPIRLRKAIRVQNTLFNQYNLLNRKKWQKCIIARDQL